MKTSRHAIALLLTPCLLVQCTITPIRPPELGRKGAGEILRRHSINVDGNGVAFKPEGLLSARREGFTESPSDRLWMRRREYETQLDDMFAALDADTRCETVLVFVHGGLVNLNQGTAESIRLTKAIQEDSGGRIRPLFVNWETGLIKSYGHHLAHDRAGISHDETGNEKLVWAMLPLVLVGNVGTGLARMPQHLVMSFSKDLQNVDDIYQNYSDYFPTKQSYHRKLRGILDIAEDGGMEERLSYQMHPGAPGKEISLYVGNDDRGGAARKLRKFAYTLPLKLTSGLLLDSVGKPAWDNMVRRTQSIFRPSRGYVTSDSKIAESSEDEGHYAAARMFFNRFAAWAHKNPEKRVILVGHSMGTIVLNEVFRHIKNIPAHEVVYMAAACSITDFCDSAGRYLEKHPQTQFYNLCLHPRSEVDEDHLVVRGSLLVWIDQHFEGPRHFTNRMLGSFENAVIAYDDLPPVSNVHLKAFPHDGEKRNSSLRGPQTHGDFSGFKFWHPEFWKPCPTPDQEIYKRL